MPPDLWSFTIRVYARPGVEQACLQLQQAGADVCLLLCGAWLGQREASCTVERLQQLTALAQPWQSTVIMPLRQLRQSWRATATMDSALAKLREQVKGLELEAEQQLLLRLEAAAQAWPTGEAKDLPAWLNGLAAQAAEQGRDALQVLRVAASQA
ncbi:TIGR02444 family protein [Pseudomonas cavernicola]|uniref:TIGR02444 family protein n=1 Tax=Pseudomonas cavernicola TaxID=2320866 RepID=A0A418XKL4_9PSED|nr:TIGR02444 family protein [Pseudomonas cavernicola]RJG12971.1 TIGR02444 family protein [Pseudomonas cavernicola]